MLCAKVEWLTLLSRLHNNHFNAMLGLFFFFWSHLRASKHLFVAYLCMAIAQISTANKPYNK